MLNLTLVTFLVFVILSYWYYKKDFSGPLFLLCASMLLCFTIVGLNYENWEISYYGFHSKTYFTFVLAVIGFFVGTAIIRALMSYKPDTLKEEIDPVIMRRTHMNFPYVMFAVMSVFLLVAYIAVKIKGKGLDFSSVSAIRASLRAIYDEEKTYGFFSSQLFEILVAIAYLSLHRIMVVKFVHKEKINKLVFVPLGSFLIFALFTTDRNILIRFFLFGLVSFVTSYEWKKSIFVRNRKLVIKVGIIGIVFALVFWSFGKMKNYKSGFERAMGIYAGSGIYAYNLWITDFDDQYTDGQQTFSVVQNTLAAVGIGEESSVPHNAEFIKYDSSNGYHFETNIYSALRPYYQDFGYAGVIIIPLLTGALFEFLYLKNKRDKFGFWWMFYCSHVYPVVYYPILEQFLKRFHFGLVYEIGWLTVLYFLVYAREGLWRVKSTT